MKAGNI